VEITGICILRKTLWINLRDGGCQYIDEKVKDLVDKKLINEAAIKNLKRFIENRDDEPQKTILDNDIKLILYNKRNIVKATKDKMKKSKLLN
jgi:indole-3-glycerol phosphate synthase